jgi:hypothetical protein
MGELPAARVQPSRPFLTTGVDYAGPIQLRLGTTRSKTITKGYTAIFICFATKAVHIEVVTSLTTEAFLAALRRFIARRGKPRTIYSGNGTNFQGASNKLREVYKILQSSSNYLQGLQQRQRWQRRLPNLQPGDLVLLREDNTTPLQWPTAVIIKTHPGKDGVVRVATLKTPKGEFKHPISKICPLLREEI